MKTTARALIAGLVLTLAAGTAWAVEADDAIEYRKAVFQVFKWNMGPMGAMAQGDRPFDREVLAKHAEQMARTADLPWQGYVDGSDLGDTASKPEVWTNRARFDELARNFEAQAARLLEVVNSDAGEREIRMEIGRLGQACRTCHDDFRISRR
ncbi:c-type cytochrome [Ectothiorhodospira shaposhnikovii]|uniref:c-type cytochrome n=1 Tax=Ectothiorhodospira shaposhnikovii TaxID=1054 RepID=UPI001EE94691|nr:cytochrome c [Ectothiorhodospira shaposhnikovii]MCG5512918.1 cytochrome c [Ectothiorhodospira shaposhnikovii]